jgi:N-acetylneuraminate synthase/N,N'-diacetyllegionaminate synthase
MILFGKDLSREIAVVAEIGVNHEGNPDAATRLMKLAHEAGADAIKFQTYTPERYASSTDPERLARVSRFALDEAAHRRLAAEAVALGATFFSTALTEDAVPFLKELCPAIKIASGDLTFEPVVRAAAGSGKPVILSTGLGTVEEIDQAVAWVRTEVGESELSRRLVLMHCVSAYPTPMAEANVRSVPFLADRYGLVIGYSNHVVGPEACLAAVALGARVIEVHFTDRRADRAFRDHALSLEPQEFAALGRAARNVASSLGTYGKSLQDCERANRAASRKGLVAARDLKAGTRLGRNDIMFARPATEFGAHEIEAVLGRTLNVDIGRGQLIPRAGVA